MSRIEEDTEKIRTYERFERGEITESEARERLGDDVIESMRREREAFGAAVQRDRSEFLTDDDRDPDRGESPADIDEEELEDELAELEAELEDDLNGE
jgi:polyhydroxyalkanoate synthesis regulator phasin